MREGNVLKHVCVSVHTWGVPPSFPMGIPPSQVRIGGTPPKVRMGGNPIQGQDVGLPQVTPAPGQVPGQDGGYPQAEHSHHVLAT